MGNDKINFLYKYRAINKYLLSSLRESSIFFNTPLHFNDPYDCNYHISISDDPETMLANFRAANVGEEYKSLSKAVEQAVQSDKMRKMMIGFIKEMFYMWAAKANVCCFSERNDSPLMWAHYANDHKGVCLVYDSEVLDNSCGPSKEVVYRDQTPELDLNETNEEKILAFFTTKSKDWEYERERRFIMYEAGTKKIPQKALRGILFGMRSTEKDQSRILRLIKKAGYKDVECYRVLMKRTEYNLFMQRIKLYKGKVVREVRPGEFGV